MFYRLFAVIALLCSAGRPTVHGHSETVVAIAGEMVILSCGFDITDNDDFPTVEWSKQGLEPNVVFLYRDNCEVHEMKHPSYRYRTSFITKELKNGNISLRISKVELSDSGIYQCLTLPKNSNPSNTTVELVVVSVTEPKLAMLSNESGGKSFQCEANCWQPLPEIEFLDDHGNNIPADEPKIEEAGGCNMVTRTANPQDATTRVICRVHQPKYNLTRVAEMTIPVGCMSRSLTIGIMCLGIILNLLQLIYGIGLTFYVCRRHCGPAEVQSHSYTALVDGAHEKHPILMDNMADNIVNVVEKLRKEKAELKSELFACKETICQLQKNKCPHLCQLNLPEQKYKIQTNSSPDISNMSSVASSCTSSPCKTRKEYGRVVRSLSDSSAQLAPKDPNQR